MTTHLNATELPTDGRSTGEMAAHIARVAARLFAAKGYDATSVREIVEASGVTKPTLYYHFGSKQGLGEALLTRPMSLLLEKLRGLIDRESEPVGLLREMFETHFDFLSAEPDRCRFFYSICFGPNSISLQAEMHEFGRMMKQTLEDGARMLAEAGLIAGDRVDSFAVACRGLIIVTSMDSIFGGQELTPGLAARIVDDLLRGFGLADPVTRPSLERGQGS